MDTLRRLTQRGGASGDLGVVATIVLQAELHKHREDAELVDQVGRVENVDPVGVVRVALDNKVALEVGHILHETVELVDAILRHELGLDRLRRDDRLTNTEAGAIVRQLMPGELAGDGVPLIANKAGERGHRGHQLVRIITLRIEVELVGGGFTQDHGEVVGSSLLRGQPVAADGVELHQIEPEVAGSW